MRYIGCHLSVSGGFCAAVRTAHSIGANTFAYFTRNPRGSQARKEDPADAAAAMALMQELYPDRYIYEENRNAFDYLYEIDTLCQLAGKKYQAKRNHINRFIKLYFFNLKEFVLIGIHCSRFKL